MFLLHLEENVTRDTLTKFPLAGYAGRHWVEHARFEGVSENVEEGMKQLFDRSKPHLAVWLWIYDPILGQDQYQEVERPMPPLGTPLLFATFCGLHTLVEFLVVEHTQGVHSWDVDDTNDKSTLLHLASREGHVEVARVLIEHGTNATARDSNGSTPLHHASHNGHMDLARVLVGHGADATVQDKTGWTPLHKASVYGHVDLSRFLIEHGADAAAQNKYAKTPLHWASQYGHVDLVRILVNHGANVTVRDTDGSTPLHRAANSAKGD